MIAQILTEEPARPRQIRPGLPRDLETVILTCLAKEPLEAVPECPGPGRATCGPCSRAGRSRPGGLLRSSGSCVTSASGARRSTGAGLAAAATVLLMIGAFVGWRYYSDWRLGRVVLTTDGPPLAAEVLPASSGDEPIGEPFDIGTRTVVALPAGDYRLRVKATGLMGQTYRVAVNRGETRTHRLTLDENRLLGSESIPFSLVTEAVMLSPGKADFIEWNGETLIRRDGSTGKPIWDAARPARPWSPSATRSPRCAGCPISAMRNDPASWSSPRPTSTATARATSSGPFAARLRFWRLSGKDGSLLWTYSADPGEVGDAAVGRGRPSPGPNRGRTGSGRRRWRRHRRT